MSAVARIRIVKPCLAMNDTISTLKGAKFGDYSVVAGNDDNLSSNSATVAVFGDCRRIRQVVEFGDSRRVRIQTSKRATIVADFGGCRRIRQQLQNFATVAVACRRNRRL